MNDLLIIRQTLVETLDLIDQISQYSGKMDLQSKDVQSRMFISQEQAFGLRRNLELVLADGLDDDQ